MIVSCYAKALPYRRITSMDNNRSEKLYCLYTDGGNIGKNPSLLGGMWSYVVVSLEGQLVRQKAGIVTPADMELPNISNNTSELLGAVYGLETMPDDWEGTWFTDSDITMRRLLYPKTPCKGVPPIWIS